MDSRSTDTFGQVQKMLLLLVSGLAISVAEVGNDYGQ